LNRSFSTKVSSKYKVWLYILSQSSEILLRLRARSFEAKHFTEIQGRMRKRVLLATRCRFFSLVGLSHPMNESRDFTDHAADPQPKQATGRLSIKAMYLR
jgi:hypothetical protein